MSKWDEEQKPHTKSKDHDKRDHGHGPHEHGLGARKPKGKPKPPVVSAMAAAAAFPSYFYVPSAPPVTDQDGTPMCVAYSSAYDQNQHDKPDLRRFNQMDHALFFKQIGGTEDGSYMTDALSRRVLFGYPELINVAASGGYPSQDGKPDTETHRIKTFFEIALTVDAIKTALMKGHGVLFIGDWAHSWFHPFASGKLPAPDYDVGGHAYWIRGWNDSYGFRLRNSWGTDWGVSGDAFLPYAFLDRVWDAWQTVDA